MDSFDYHDGFFTLFPHYFVTSNLKGIFEQSNFFNISFKKISYLQIGLNLKDSKPDIDWDESSFYMVSFQENDKDFIIFENKLILSQRALDFLVCNNGFKYKIFGSPFGKEFEYIDNVYQIRGSIEQYFKSSFENDLNYIREKEQMLLQFMI